MAKEKSQARSGPPQPSSPIAPRSDDATVVVEWQSEVHRLQAEPEETVLAAARRHGLELPFSCLAGACGACLATLVSGRVDHLAGSFALGEKKRARGLILVCRAVPRGGACRIRFEPEETRGRAGRSASKRL